MEQLAVLSDWREPLILQVWKEAVMEREELTQLVR